MHFTIHIFLCLVTFEAVFVSGVRPSFRSFEDYLQHLDKNLQSSIIRLGGDGSEIDSSSKEMNISSSSSSPPSSSSSSSIGLNAGSTETSLMNSIVDEEKKNVTCCILGELAGDKGFHCFAEFYAARIVLRNMNRAHNRKLGFYGRFRIPRYGERLMKTFEQCVAGHGQVFHRCCHMATIERRQMMLRATRLQRKSKNNNRPNNNNSSADLSSGSVRGRESSSSSTED